MVAKILEVTMLVLFGFSWPFNLIKSIRNQSTKGKSLLFLILFDLGYVTGIMSEYISDSFIWSTDWWVFAIYVINLSFITADLIMYFIDRNKEKKAELTAAISNTYFFKMFYLLKLFERKYI